MGCYIRPKSDANCADCDAINDASAAAAAATAAERPAREPAVEACRSVTDDTDACVSHAGAEAGDETRRKIGVPHF